MYSTTDLDSAARSSHTESSEGDNAIDAYMDKLAKVVELMTGDFSGDNPHNAQFAEWHNVFGDMLRIAVSDTMESVPLDLDRMIKVLDPFGNLPMASAHVMHDLGGIVGHYDPITGELDPTFMPRFAKLEHHWVDDVLVD